MVTRAGTNAAADQPSVVEIAAGEIVRAEDAGIEMIGDLAHHRRHLRVLKEKKRHDRSQRAENESGERPCA